MGRPRKLLKFKIGDSVSENYKIVKEIDSNNWTVKCTCGAEYDLTEGQLRDKKYKKVKSCVACRDGKRAKQIRKRPKNAAPIWLPVPEIGKLFIAGKHNG